MKSHTMTSTLIALFATVILLIMPGMAIGTEFAVSSGRTGTDPMGMDPMCVGTSENWVTVKSSLEWYNGEVLSFEWRFATEEWGGGMQNDVAGFRLTGTDGIPQTRLIDVDSATVNPTPPPQKAFGPQTYSVALTCAIEPCNGDFEIYAANVDGCQTPSALFVDDATVLVSPAASPIVSIDDVSVEQDDGSANFTVSVSTAAVGDIEVSYTTQDGGARDPWEYSAVSGNVIIPNGSTTALTPITVPIVDNGGWGSPLTYKVVLTGIVSGSATIGDSFGIGTINPYNHRAEFFPGLYSVSENGPIGTVIVPQGNWYVNEMDDPATPNGTLTYTITAGNGGGEFAIDAATGRITTNTVFDYEALGPTPHFQLTISALDGGGLEADTNPPTGSPPSGNIITIKSMTSLPYPRHSTIRRPRPRADR